MSRMKVGDTVEPLLLESIQGGTVQIPAAERFTHLQFRRFAGCPICNLHLQSFIQRHPELLANKVQEVAVFHSSRSAMLEHQAGAPFPFIADSGKKLYKVFGVESSILSVLNPKAWPAAVKGLLTQGPGRPARGESALGLPADFLIDGNARIVAVKYGTHASDHWELEELLELVRTAQLRAQPGDPIPGEAGES